MCCPSSAPRAILHERDAVQHMQPAASLSIYCLLLLLFQLSFHFLCSKFLHVRDPPLKQIRGFSQERLCQPGSLCSCRKVGAREVFPQTWRYNSQKAAEPASAAEVKNLLGCRDAKWRSMKSSWAPMFYSASMKVPPLPTSCVKHACVHSLLRLQARCALEASCALPPSVQLARRPICCGGPKTR